jgi:hypothetical protein
MIKATTGREVTSKTIIIVHPETEVLITDKVISNIIENLTMREIM